MYNPTVKLGILGGGQLGKMLIQAASSYHLDISVLDPSADCPASQLCTHFVQGDFKDYQAVLDFGRNLDVLTIEIENVNVKALEELKEMGKVVNPSPEIIRIIQDKGLQKEFYREHQLPTANFQLFKSAADIRQAVSSGHLKLPFIQKTRKEGYDGRGVLVVNNASQLDDLMDKPSVIEAKIDFEKELAIIVASNQDGEISCFPTVEMEFNPDANLVEFLISPANITQEIEKEARQLATKLAKAFNLNGILAVELFLTGNGEVLINEVAPRPHNSGHQTIEANMTSQYEQHLRAILNWPLGSTRQLMNAVMVNLLGEVGHSGEAKYFGVEDVLKIEGAKIHLYGKSTTKDFRKMGHVTIIDDDKNLAMEKAKKVKSTLKIMS